MRENTTFEKDMKMLSNATQQNQQQLNGSQGNTIGLGAIAAVGGNDDVNMESYDQGEMSSIVENPSIMNSAVQENKRRSATANASANMDSKTRKKKR